MTWRLSHPTGWCGPRSRRTASTRWPSFSCAAWSAESSSRRSAPGFPRVTEPAGPGPPPYPWLPGAMMAPMATESFSLAPASDSALLVTLGDRMASEVSRRVRRLLRRLDEAALAGVVDFSPAYASILIRFDPRRTDHK